MQAFHFKLPVNLPLFWIFLLCYHLTPEHLHHISSSSAVQTSRKSTSIAFFRLYVCKLIARLIFPFG
jgi:hypothetical protein